MDNLLEAIKNNDLIKAQRAFNEGMKSHVVAILEREKQRIGSSIFIEGEEKPDEDDGDDDDDDDDEDNEDNDDKPSKGKDED